VSSLLTLFPTGYYTVRAKLATVRVWLHALLMILCGLLTVCLAEVMGESDRRLLKAVSKGKAVDDDRIRPLFPFQVPLTPLSHALNVYGDAKDQAEGHTVRPVEKRGKSQPQSLLQGRRLQWVDKSLTPGPLSHQNSHFSKLISTTGF
jgi:hypothetical protein